MQHSFGAAAAADFAAEDAAVMAESVKSMAETVREELARYLLRLLQAAARHAATAVWSPDSLSRDLAVRRLSPCALALELCCAGALSRENRPLACGVHSACAWQAGCCLPTSPFASAPTIAVCPQARRWPKERVAGEPSFG